MRVLDIISSPWGIIPEKLREIAAIYEAHLRGEKINIKAIEAQFIKVGGVVREEGYINDNGVAIIPVRGPLMKGRGGIFSFLFGASSTDTIHQAFSQALNDDQVHAIVFLIDSPGGLIGGIQELSTAIYEGRGKKPISAFTDGDMASAAYWIGSAASDVYISGNTNRVGSIGVVTLHVDESKANEKYGETITEIYAGKYKRIASPYQPLSDEGRQYLQGQVDYLYSVFIDDIAKNRGVSPETVLTNMADGRIFIGNQAIEAGLVDGVSAMDSLVNKLKPSRADQIRATIQSRVQEVSHAGY